jgi:signal transduction histidine kinase/DNA-binding response OmpR family regulator/HPt (histidine-containing phosphotransfer) domain-containing protein
MSALVLISSIYINAETSRTTNDHYASLLKLAEQRLRGNIFTAESQIDAAAFLVSELYKGGAEPEAIQRFIVSSYNWRDDTHDTLFSQYSGIYGYIDGRFVNSEGWIPPEGYDPTIRPWYTGAVRAGGRYFYSDPYIDTYSDSALFSISKEIYDAKGASIGVLSIDIRGNFLSDLLDSVDLKEGGSAVLLDDSFDVLADSDGVNVGYNAGRLEYYKKAVSLIKNGEGTLRGVEIKSPAGDNIANSRTLDNGWRLVIITPKADYFKNGSDISLAVAFVSLAISIILCYILLKINLERTRHESESITKNSFLSRISHEIRTPMNIIIGMSELIIRKDAGDDVHSHAANIKIACSNLLSIINDILDYSKMESGHFKISREKYSFISLLDDVEAIVGVQAGETKLAFTVNIDPSVPAQLYGDELHIRQMLLHILGNAVKYTRSGAVSLRVWSDPTADNDGNTLLYFEIKDTGSGIAPENMDKLFSSFSRLDGGTNQTPGAGLGLAITKRICDAMNAEIEVRSAQGEGTVFTVTLPQEAAGPEPAASLESPDISVLIYETNEYIAASLLESVSSLGARAELADNYNKFYNMVRGSSYHFVLVDEENYLSATDVVTRLKIYPAEVIVMVSQTSSAKKSERRKTVTAPATSIKLAAVLNHEENGDTDEFTDTVTFTAPDARILVVDDIATNLMVAEGLLSPYEMKVDTCLSGAEAIELARVTKYNIIFMDHMMPGMDGLEATARIRALDRGDGFYASMPIIALTANAMVGMKTEFIRNGMNDFLAKPIECEKLNAVLEAWIPKSMKQPYVPEILREDDAPADSFDSMAGLEPVAEKGKDKPKPKAPAKAQDGLVIDGVNTRAGIASVGGSEKVYAQTLLVFRKDSLARLRQISVELARSDLTLYKTYVHALKSASGSIGAKELSSLAARLEDAAKNSDYYFIEENTGAFLELLGRVCDGIKAALGSQDRDENQATKDPAALLSLCGALKEAIDSMDMSAVDEILPKLEACGPDQETARLIAKISENLLVFDTDEAQSNVEKIMERCKPK